MDAVRSTFRMGDSSHRRAAIHKAESEALAH